MLLSAGEANDERSTGCYDFGLKLLERSSNGSYIDAASCNSLLITWSSCKITQIDTFSDFGLFLGLSVVKLCRYSSTFDTWPPDRLSLASSNSNLAFDLLWRPCCWGVALVAEFPLLQNRDPLYYFKIVPLKYSAYASVRPKLLGLYNAMWVLI